MGQAPSGDTCCSPCEPKQKAEVEQVTHRPASVFQDGLGRPGGFRAPACCLGPRFIGLELAVPGVERCRPAGHTAGGSARGRARLDQNTGPHPNGPPAAAGDPFLPDTLVGRSSLEAPARRTERLGALSALCLVQAGRRTGPVPLSHLAYAGMAKGPVFAPQQWLALHACRLGAGSYPFDGALHAGGAASHL